MSENQSEPRSDAGEDPPREKKEEKKEEKKSKGFRAYCTIGIGYGPPKRKPKPKPKPTDTPGEEAPRKPRKPWRLRIGKLAVGILCSVAPPEDDPGPLDPLQEEDKDQDP